MPRKKGQAWDKAALFRTVTWSLSFSHLTSHRSKKLLFGSPLILNIIKQCAFKSTRYVFSISLKAEGKKDGLYCCEYQEGFPYNYRIKHAFLLSTLLVTPAPLYTQISSPEKARGLRIVEWRMRSQHTLFDSWLVAFSCQLNKRDTAFW